MPQPIYGAPAVYDGNGHIFVFGGMTGTATSASTLTGNVEEYTIASDSWSTLSVQMPTAATQAAAVLGTDGMIYVLGGKGASNHTLTSVQVYNPAQDTWSQGTPLPHALYNEAAVIDALGEINVIGQYSSNGAPVQVVYVSPVLANVAPMISTTSLPSAMAGNPYAAWVTVTATPAATISVQSGPAGLNIDPNTGEITWTSAEGMANTQQSVTIQATNAYGTATQTISIAVTPDTTVPTAPSYPTVGANITSTSLPLTWTASTDGDGVAGYNLYKYIPPVGHSGRGGGITKPAQYILLVTGIPGPSYTVMGLAPGTTYQYALAAYDGAGNVSPYSNVVTGTTYIAPTILVYLNGALASGPFSVVANHQLYLGIADPGNPTPTMTMSSAPSGVVFSEGLSGASITWTPTAAQVGVNDIIMQSTNVVGTTTLDIKVTVAPDLPVPSLSFNGGITYTVGNMTTSGSPPAYQLALIPAFNNTGTSPQYGMSGTPLTFQVTGTSNTNPTTYSLVSGPAGMTLDPNTGIATWTPSATEAGTTNVEVGMTNGAGTSLFTFTFPTYFTTAPTNVALAVRHRRVEHSQHGAEHGRHVVSAQQFDGCGGLQGRGLLLQHQHDYRLRYREHGYVLCADRPKFRAGHGYGYGVQRRRQPKPGERIGQSVSGRVAYFGMGLQCAERRCGAGVYDAVQFESVHLFHCLWPSGGLDQSNHGFAYVDPDAVGRGSGHV